MTSATQHSDSASGRAAALIVGCGYLGQRVAERLLQEGRVVYGTTRSPDKARQLAERGVRPMLLHITQPVTFASLRPALEAESLDVYHMIPPGRPGQHPTPRQTVLGGIAHVIKALKRANVRRGVLVSSTAVYGQQDGRLVDAQTPAVPTSERGKLLLEGEQLWLNGSETHHVVRLAGIYGPSRVIGMKAVFDGAPLLGDPQALLNLIHVDDAAALLLKLMTAEAPGRVELGCDGHPVARMTYYAHLAKQMNLDPPTPLDDETAAARFGLNVERLKRSSSKALDNIPTCQRTGWSPQYPNFREGLEAVLAKHR